METAINIATAAAPVALGLLAALVPLLRALGAKDKAATDRAKLAAATKAAYLIVSSVASKTANKFDDNLALVLQLADAEFSQTRGRHMNLEEHREATARAVTMSADPALPGSLGEIDEAVIAKLAPLFPVSPQAKQRVEP